MHFPRHRCGLYLRHNEHRDCYEPLATFLEHEEKTDWFASAEAVQQALETDEYWELQWYPDTPVGFYGVAAPTLEALLTYALQVEAGHA